MIKKTMTYTDYNGVERTEDKYFHLTEAELVEMELCTEGGFVDKVNRIVNAKETPEIIKNFKEIILKAYGEKSPDGKRFLKVNEDGKPLYIEFSQTEAYSKLFMELVTDDKAASDFINGILPDMSKYKS